MIGGAIKKKIIIHEDTSKTIGNPKETIKYIVCSFVFEKIKI